MPRAIQKPSVRELVRISRRLGERADSLKFGAPVHYVYNPLIYARVTHEKYLERFGEGPKQVVLLGMNPGPFGMVQTGVPFGDVTMVRDWLGIQGAVGKPAREHPKRPVLGFGCTRSEVSGSRLWGWAQRRFRNPDRFFRDFLVANYCPLAFLDAGGKNLTPDKLTVAAGLALLAACDQALADLVTVLEPRVVIGVGAFAEQCARRALAGRSIAIGRIAHPSPASPVANRGWVTLIERQLEELGVLWS